MSYEQTENASHVYRYHNSLTPQCKWVLKILFGFIHKSQANVLILREVIGSEYPRLMGFKEGMGTAWPQSITVSEAGINSDSITCIPKAVLLINVRRIGPIASSMTQIL